LIQQDPGFIVGPIARFLGYIIDFVFNIVYPFTERNSLGISIIILTIIIRFIMLPLAIKSQKSMMAMQKLAPEMEKIKKKYAGNKDPENQKKMQAEMQALYTKNKVSPLGGCLPMIIQMPIFIALTHLMNQSFLYITKLRDVYESLAYQISTLQCINPNPAEFPQWAQALAEKAVQYVPNNFGIFQFIASDLVPPEHPFFPYRIPDMTEAAARSNLVRLLNRLQPDEWEYLFNGVFYDLTRTAPEQLELIRQLYDQKNNIEIFFGLNIIETAGWGFPGILIPILTVLTTFLTSWLSMKLTAQANKDNPQAKMQQRMMMIVMPAMMGFFTINIPIGVGIYWITSSIFQVVQQAILNKRSSVSPKEKK